MEYHGKARFIGLSAHGNENKLCKTEYCLALYVRWVLDVIDCGWLRYLNFEEQQQQFISVFLYGYMVLPKIEFN